MVFLVGLMEDGEMEKVAGNRCFLRLATAVGFACAPRLRLARHPLQLLAQQEQDLIGIRNASHGFLPQCFVPLGDNCPRINDVADNVSSLSPPG